MRFLFLTLLAKSCAIGGIVPQQYVEENWQARLCEDGRRLQELRFPQREELQEAIRLARLAEFGESSAQTAAEELNLSGWERLNVWEGTGVCARAWLLKKGDKCAVSFRGTAREASDWLRNFQTSASDFLDIPGKLCKAHEGFLEEYNELKTAGGNLTAAIECGRDASGGLLVVGHSQGGAVANLFALETVHRGWLPVEKLRVITFGEPLNTASCGDPGLDKVRVVTAAPVHRFVGVDRPQEIDPVAQIGFSGGEHLGPTLFVFAGGAAESLPDSEGWTFGPLQTSSLVPAMLRSVRGVDLHRIHSGYIPALDALSRNSAYFRSDRLTASEVRACRESGTGGWSVIDCQAKRRARCERCMADVDCESNSCRRHWGVRVCTGLDRQDTGGCPFFGRG
uniref:Fungal lipase-type domain-containing protein n=1 Tax=Chromera velia CCMP2878 TaxID=1169474 RepID=A0A0G4IE70_9ALVE|eukprot:Cvel_13523.t1-p1 / transcript=Cvel_13523.t1 / gene=Cvel_13523 / organism=Chromera_velia_CCMP2878 / gene_product=hypothetical protein / transcript_product=hypothetical protein / location=Cvel_scaffold927:51880-54238(-) / protein_length=395 / sequence_SO=supercontig / SO=protein_coding / is_pseudo=false